jgi:predicted  nucleic acid-binding Zn-ribbon protein
MGEWLAAHWHTLGTFVIAILLSIDKFREWQRRREHAESDHVKELKRLVAEVEALRTRHFDLSQEMHVCMIKIAVLETQVKALNED